MVYMINFAIICKCNRSFVCTVLKNTFRTFRCVYFKCPCVMNGNNPNLQVEHSTLIY